MGSEERWGVKIELRRRVSANTAKAYLSERRQKVLVHVGVVGSLVREGA
jgi:hypothetical protein